MKRLGHQAPKGYIDTRFNSISIDGDLAYCASHNFIYNSELEKEKLYNGLPCYYTDARFKDGSLNFYKECKIHWTRWTSISLKACIRKVLKCKNIPVGTIINFGKSHYVPNKKIDLSFSFKVKNENNLDLDYQVSKSNYTQNFTNCKFSQELVEALRSAGFLVSVTKNESFINGMINSAISFTGGDFIDSEIEGDVAICYGFGKKIGFSSFKNDFLGYRNGCENILWDQFGEFDKWSRCNEISKESPILEIIEILKTKNT